jgi:hypothetical protein
LRAVFTRLAQCLTGIRHKAALSRLSIPGRLILLVLALAVPLNLVIGGVVWGLVNRANEIQRTSLLYAARSIAAGVDAELGKYVALAEAVSVCADSRSAHSLRPSIRNSPPFKTSHHQTPSRTD